MLGTLKGAATDFDGNFSFNVEAGTYSILPSYVGFKNDTLRSVSVDPGNNFGQAVGLKIFKLFTRAT